ncbi:TetR/AcrR family transcriptional regulator [Natronorubrum thiooxidans]|uniref:Transcriptional regulator, TetR family n=1 Tax=Natronorubrum thiooxidans TaxID=308853 RepID=A0A1N7CNI2_9EURY|nr:TetR/AcrR family transcriptional regulator [Natronorubrum thiooxidans]SIR65133.1 transcriptional regulator, TetR family [Natronorubrum thiooxidans]
MTNPDIRDAIMTATYEALCEEGYSDLTAQAIADRTDRSKSALFYHYGSREAIVAEFIEYLIEGIELRVAKTRDRPALERLAAFVDWFLSEPDDDERAFHTALLELRAQAPYNDVFRAKLRESNDRLQRALEEILRDGLEEGVFQAHDPEAVAALLLAAFDGAQIRQVTLGRNEYLETIRAGTVDHVLADILKPDVEFPETVAFEFPPDERLRDSSTADERTERDTVR